MIFHPGKGKNLYLPGNDYGPRGVVCNDWASIGLPIRNFK